MTLMPYLSFLVTYLTGGRKRTERGGGGVSVETVLLLAGAIAVAGLVVVAITAFVRGHLPG